MVTFPRAKINIGLRITDKREDGYHNIETLFYPVPLCDALEFVVSDDREIGDILTVTGIETGGMVADNLVMKAVKRLRKDYDFPHLRMHLHKAIPPGAGLGGGSSDAAYILKGINRCYGLNLDNEQLRAIALELGSDCPFFIDASPAYATGRGEILVPCERKIPGNPYLVLLNPGIVVNTREAYLQCLPAKPVKNLSSLIENLSLSRWKGEVLNDFEGYAFGKYPLIGWLKDELYRSGAVFSLMSGSGSTVYGIFTNKPAVPENLKQYVIWKGFLHEPIPVR
jgi:4-diphosphocytidyl-2-C-methyl-D-erythritol kinase